MTEISTTVRDSIDDARAALAGGHDPVALTFERLADPLLEERGQHVASRYVESFWLPIIGPSALWLLRHVALHTEHGPYEVDVVTLAQSLGLNETGTFSPHAPLHKTLDRLARFRCGDGWSTTWRLRTHLPQLSARRVDRLPDPLRDQHAALLGDRGEQ